MSLAMSLRARGRAASAARAGKVLSRFGITADAMIRRLDRYDAITGKLGIRPTWPTTASVLARHPNVLRRYSDRGIELALHGLVHGDHALLDERQQRVVIAGAANVFERNGLKPTGFRGPYLRYNPATLAALRALGLRYHSSQAVSFPLCADPEPARAGAYELALELYAARDARRIAVTPKMQDGLVDIPVAIPDDETMVERLRLAGDGAARQWFSMLEATYGRGELFTLQLHPERICELGSALEATLTEARRRRPQILVATLDELALWWSRRSRFSLSVTRSGGCRFRVRLDADDDATLLVRGLEVPRTAWYGADAVSRDRDFQVEGARAPIVGVSRRSPPDVQRLLREEGLPFEVAEDAAAYGAYVDVTTDRWTESDVLDAIDRSSGPLVRLWRWPREARSALAVSGDIDALTLFDFAVRSWETRSGAFGGGRR